MSLSATEQRLTLCKLLCLTQTAVAFAALCLAHRSGADLVRIVAVDALAYRDEILSAAPLRLHTRLYQLFAPPLQPAWAASALNLLGLVLVFYKTPLGPRARWGGALIPVVLLSFLFHNLLPLKDSLFLCLYVYFLYSLGKGPRTLGTSAGLAVMFFALARLRPEMGFLLCSFLVLSGALLAGHRSFQPRRWLLVSLCLLLVSAVVVEMQPECQQVAQQTHQLSNVSSRVLWLRYKFSARYPNAGSNQPQPPITAPERLVQRLPQALLTGALAPWPLRSEQCRFPGCGLVLGLEMFGLYLLWAGVLLTLRRSALLLTLFVALGLSSLGLVVVNLGALYRLRYPYVVLLLLMGLKACYSRGRCSDGSPPYARKLRRAEASSGPDSDEPPR